MCIISGHLLSHGGTHCILVYQADQQDGQEERGLVDGVKQKLSVMEEERVSHVMKRDTSQLSVEKDSEQRCREFRWRRWPRSKINQSVRYRRVLQSQACRRSTRVWEEWSQDQMRSTCSEFILVIHEKEDHSTAPSQTPALTAVPHLAKQSCNEFRGLKSRYGGTTAKPCSFGQVASCQFESHQPPDLKLEKHHAGTCFWPMGTHRLVRRHVQGCRRISVSRLL